MKKTVFGLILFALPLLASAASFDTNLQYGLTNNTNVVALQEFLADQKVYTGPITGNFYSLTLAAVKQFQITKGITPVSGYVGPITRGVFNAILAIQIPVPVQPTTTPVNPNSSFMEVHVPAGTAEPVVQPTSTPKTACELKVEDISKQIIDLGIDTGLLVDGGYKLIPDRHLQSISYKGKMLTYLQANSQYVSDQTQIKQLVQDKHYLSLTCDL